MSEIRYAFFNEQILEKKKIQWPLQDIGLLRGFSIFDFLRVHNSKPIFVINYLNRLAKSARLAGISFPYQQDYIQNTIHQLIDRNGFQEAGIRILLTGGVSPNSFEPASVPNLLILQEPLHFPGSDYYKCGVHVITHTFRRELPEIKTTNYFRAVHLLPEADKNKAYDVLYCTEAQVLEFTRSNFFMVKDNEIHTPDSGILLGVTRRKVIEIAKDEHIPIVEREIQLKELANADEVFLSSTTKKVLPVTVINHQNVGNGLPGSITKKLMNIFDDLVSSQ